VHVEQGSLYNTPNTWGIYILERVCAWIEDGPGGLAGVAARNKARADAVYAAIEKSGGFYKGRALPGSRSMMNVTFTTGDADLDTAFHQGAAKAGLSGLKGHKSIGGLRASLYNAQTDAAVDALVDWMGRFKASRG
jgi:phosphoserine aminotransferase